MLFTRLGRFVLGKPVPKVLSPMWTSKLANNTYLLLKGIPRPIRGIISCNGVDADSNRFQLHRVGGMFYIKETSKRLSISRYLLHLKARKN